jgi:hypothetical protein
VLRKEGIQLQRHRSWCVSTDPEFAAKAADVIGLYLNPPQNALVLSVDEKPSIAIPTQKHPFLTCFKDALDCVTNARNTSGICCALRLASAPLKLAINRYF